ncbi:MAG: KilA-N domain-containing protein [Methylococcaceae bacterium]
MGRSTVHYADNQTNNILKALHNKLRPAGTPVQRVEYILELLLLRMFEVKLKRENEFKKEAGLNSFSLTLKKWIAATKAIGFQSKAGRYGGGTYAHKDIAFEFGSWLSSEFKLYLIKEFQRLKESENQRLSLECNP